MKITMAESFGVETRGSFYDAAGALRDVVQNHLLQTLARHAVLHSRRKRLPLTMTTEVFIQLREAAGIDQGERGALRFRFGPGAVEIELAGRVRRRGRGMKGKPLRFLTPLASGDDCDAYVRLLGGALDGDSTVFVPQAAVEQASRVVDPLQETAPPVEMYAPGSWGPKVAERFVTEGSGWHDPEPATRTGTGG